MRPAARAFNPLGSVGWLVIVTAVAGAASFLVLLLNPAGVGRPAEGYVEDEVYSFGNLVL